MNSGLRAPVTLRLPFSNSSVPVARAGLVDWMVELGSRPETIEDARIVVSELVANSVRHARPLADGSIVVAWCLGDDGVEVSVADGGSQTRPRSLHAPSSALAGRGIAIVEALSRRWWAESSASRSTVHALLDA